MQFRSQCSIAAAADEQSSVAQEVNKNLESVREIAQTTTEETKNTTYSE